MYGELENKLKLKTKEESSDPALVTCNVSLPTTTAMSAVDKAPPELPPAIEHISSVSTYTGKQPQRYLYNSGSSEPALKLTLRVHPLSVPDTAAQGHHLVHLLCSRLERCQREIRAAEARNHEQILYLGLLQSELETTARAVDKAQSNLEQATETSDVERERLHIHLTACVAEHEAAQQRLHEQFLYAELVWNEVVKTVKAAEDAERDVSRACTALRIEGISVSSSPHSCVYCPNAPFLHA
uniref:Uncharacterized protein n=1 Tax=Mycena chlorophos TaxID=658473 RepID=A0ABQ0L7J3_MYCCL|nr:predicted protein [Mycena chlorophos]